MKNSFVATIALVLVCGTAPAADFPSKKAPPTPSPAFTWTGLYIGLNFGYLSRGDGAIRATSANILDTTAGWGPASALGGSGATDARLNGFVSGGQAGYNWQFAESFVAGFEADIDGAGVRGGGGLNSLVPASIGPGAFAVTGATLKRSLEYLGTARGRLGYAVTPNILVYATGGLAFGGTNVNATINQTLFPSLLTGNAAKVAYFENRAGWTAGAGVEWAFARNISAKLEYLYYDLGAAEATNRIMSPLAFADLLGALRLANATQVSTRFDGHVIRAGLNYRFDWSIPPTSGSAATPAFVVPQFVAVAPTAPEDWRFSLTPYMWAIATNGSSTSRGQTVSVDTSFVDAFTETSAFPLAFMGHFEARNGPVSFYGDVVWGRMRFSGSSLALRSPLADFALAMSASARLRQTIGIGEAGGAYEVARWKLAGSENSFTAVDALAGLRYWYIGLDLSLDVIGAFNSQLLGLSQIGGRAVARADNMQWIDPVVGLRLRHQLSPGNEFQMRGDVGGFGAGSKFSWQFYSGYNHDFTFQGLNFTGVVGYRVLSVDYSQGSGNAQDGMKAIMHGPVSGVGLRF